jgi:hypothetical protein
MKPPRGMQITAAKKADDKEMKRDLVVISTTWGLRVAISMAALTRPFQISSNQLHH